MLQPLQLKDVSVRHAADIAELRDFLATAGIPVETGGALRAAVERLPQDRGFHRDLTSYVWVVIDRWDRQIRMPDLLGILTLALSGIRFAVASDEDDAHHLLRFLMEAQHSLQAEDAPRPAAVRPQPAAATPQPVAVPAQPVALPPRPVAVPPPPVAVMPPPASVAPAAPAVPAPAAEEVEAPKFSGRQRPAEDDRVVVMPGDDRRSRRAWVAGSCALAIALAAGLWWVLRSSAPPVKPAVIVDAPASAPVPAVSARPSPYIEPAPIAPTPMAPAAPVTRTQPVVAGRVRPTETGGARTAAGPVYNPMPAAATPAPATVPAVPTVSAVRIPAGPVGTAPAATPPMAAPIVRAGAAALPVARSTAPLIPRAAGPAKVPAAVPAATLSQQLGARTVPTYAAADSDPAHGNSRYPRLLRRNTGPFNEYQGNDVVASNVPPKAVPGRPAAVAVPAGVVRSTALGMMAGNVLYSPSPAYPSAAAIAHVQGEVKLQAEVGRDGSVDSARVISGPPQLRDAALDAVQHWKYKPWTAGGKAVPVSTTAVVEFELQ